MTVITIRNALDNIQKHTEGISFKESKGDVEMLVCHLNDRHKLSISPLALYSCMNVDEIRALIQREYDRALLIMKFQHSQPTEIVPDIYHA